MGAQPGTHGRRELRLLRGRRGVRVLEVLLCIHVYIYIERER